MELCVSTRETPSRVTDLWRRLRRNAGSVAAVTARRALEPASLGGLLEIGVAPGVFGQSIAALSAGRLVSSGTFGPRRWCRAVGRVDECPRAATSGGGPPRGLLVVGGGVHASGSAPRPTLPTSRRRRSSTTLDSSAGTPVNGSDCRQPPRASAHTGTFGNRGRVTGGTRSAGHPSWPGRSRGDTSSDGASSDASPRVRSVLTLVGPRRRSARSPRGRAPTVVRSARVACGRTFPRDVARRSLSRRDRVGRRCR